MFVRSVPTKKLLMKTNRIIGLLRFRPTDQSNASHVFSGLMRALHTRTIHKFLYDWFLRIEAPPKNMDRLMQAPYTFLQFDEYLAMKGAGMEEWELLDGRVDYPFLSFGLHMRSMTWCPQCYTRSGLLNDSLSFSLRLEADGLVRDVGERVNVPVLERPNASNAEHQHCWPGQSSRHNQHMYKFSVVDQLNRSDDHSSEVEASPCAKRNCRGVLRVFEHLQSAPTYLTLDTPCFRLVSNDSNETVKLGNPIRVPTHFLLRISEFDDRTEHRPVKPIVRIADQKALKSERTRWRLIDKLRVQSREYYALYSLRAFASHSGKSIAEGYFEAYAFDSSLAASLVADRNNDVERLLPAEKQAVRDYLDDCVLRHRWQRIVAEQSAASNSQQAPFRSELPTAFEVPRIHAGVSRVDQLLDTGFASVALTGTKKTSLTDLLNEFEREAAFRVEENFKRPQYLVYRRIEIFELPSEQVLVFYPIILLSVC